MNQRDLLNKISDYLSTFQLQVKISTKNSLYDINVHSETVLIPIFNILYCGDFINLNFADKNADTIDLLDRNTGIAFQVTSTSKLEKIKHTLQSYMDSKYRAEIKQLYIYILSEKQRSYSDSPLKKIIGKKIPFSVEKNILDATDLFGQIKVLSDLDQIKAIYHLLRKQFSELYILEDFTGKDFETFKAQYAKSCLTNFKRLNFFGISVSSNRPRETDLYHLFVEPRFLISNSASNRFVNLKQTQEMHYWLGGETMSLKSNNFPIQLYDTKAFSYVGRDIEMIDNFSGLFTFHKHLVILGNPGAGKSSIVKYAVCKILEQAQSVFLNHEVFKSLPIRIELHKYNKIRVEKSIGFITYLAELLKEEYHSQISAVQLEQILRHFPTVLFFDGMDEIFDVHERIDVRNDIEGLIRIYPTVRAIVTSRYESYTEVKMDGRLFEVVELKNFQDDQVKLYTEKWYSLEEQDPNVRNPELNDCLQQLERVDAELKYNPLLLSLILILYRNALEIPTSKLEIYENCTTTIMEYRDTKEKKLNFGLGVTNPLAVFSALAFWQFENDEKRASVNHIEVHKFLKRYFLDKGVFEDPNISSKEATLFLDFAKLRSLYFENKFTHKTFLEFFTANYLYSTYYLKPNNQHLFKEVVTKNIGIASWNVVLELLISLIDQGQIDFEVIDQLLEQQLNDNPIAASQFFLNLLRYLKNVSPAKIELLLSRGISICIEQHGVKGKFSSVQRIFELIVSLAKLPRFMPLIEKAFLGLQEASGDNFEELSVFAYELSIVSGESFLVNALKRLSVHNSTDYLHLLRNYDALLTKESYLKEIAFLVKQGKGGSFFQDQFSSWFGQKLFFGSNTFNYPLSFLLTRDMQHINEDYQKLKDAGISFHDIFAAARTSFPLARILPETFLDSYGMLKHKELIRIVKSVQLVNSSSVRMEKSNSKFYDALFTKPGYNKR